MTKTSLIALVTAAALAQGCTVVGVVAGAISAKDHNDERQARIAAGYLDAAQEPVASEGHRAIFGGLLGLAADAAVVFAVTNALSNIGPIYGGGDGSY
jgi:hypothetical protein